MHNFNNIKWPERFPRNLRRPRPTNETIKREIFLFFYIIVIVVLFFCPCKGPRRVHVFNENKINNTRCLLLHVERATETRVFFRYVVFKTNSFHKKLNFYIVYVMYNELYTITFLSIRYTYILCRSEFGVYHVYAGVNARLAKYSHHFSNARKKKLLKIVLLFIIKCFRHRSYHLVFTHSMDELCILLFYAYSL